jgi:hypothetical protein
VLLQLTEEEEQTNRSEERGMNPWEVTHPCENSINPPPRAVPPRSKHPPWAPHREVVRTWIRMWVFKKDLSLTNSCSFSGLRPLPQRNQQFTSLNVPPPTLTHWEINCLTHELLGDSLKPCSYSSSSMTWGIQICFSEAQCLHR